MSFDDDKSDNEKEREITLAQTRASLILLLVAQTLSILLLIVYFTQNFSGGVIVVLLFLAIAILRRLYVHLFPTVVSDASEVASS